MTDKTTVFDSKINEVIRNIESLKKESNPEKMMNALTGLFGLKTQDKQALSAYTKSVDGLLEYARAIKTTLTNLSKTNTDTKIENKRLKEELVIAINTLNTQKNDLERIGKLLEYNKTTIENLKNDNKTFEEAK